MAKGGVVPSASHLTENVPNRPVKTVRFRLIDAYMKPVAERVWYVKGRRAQRKAGKLQVNKREKRRKKGDAEKAQHRALQTGPSRVVPHRSQYYPANLLNFAECSDGKR